MCIDPVSMSIIAMSATALSAGVSAAGASSQASSQAAVANYNAKIAGYQATAVEQEARTNEQQTYKQGDLLEGHARAAMGANGIDPNSGTALQTQTDIGKQTGLNVADQQFNADTQSWGFKNQQGLLTAQASADQTAGAIGIGTSLLGGASQVGNQWNAFKSNFATSSPSTGYGLGTQVVGDDSWGGA